MAKAPPPAPTPAPAADPTGTKPARPLSLAGACINSGLSRLATETLLASLPAEGVQKLTEAIGTDAFYPLLTAIRNAAGRLQAVAESRDAHAAQSDHPVTASPDPER
jgi:hypothetical protein